MISYTCSLAHIIFFTESNYPLKLFEYENLFSGKSTGAYDVHNSLRSIDHNELKASAVPKNIRHLVTACTISPASGRGVHAIPLQFVDIHDDRLQPFLFTSSDILDAPILQSRAVRESLESRSAHLEQVFIAIHALTVEIRDYLKHEYEIFYADGLASLVQSDLMYNGFRNMFSAFLPDFSAVMIHGSSVLLNGRAAIFLAPDEGGKSTAARLSHRKKIFSDDRNILRKQSQGFMVHGTPWGMITSGPDFARLGGIFLLEKAESFSIDALKPRSAVQFIWEDNSYFWRQLPRKRRAGVFDLVLKLCQSVPLYRMRFPKDYIDWDAVDRAMEKG